MNGLTIRCLQPSPQRINLFGVVPNRLANLTWSQIQQLPIESDELTRPLREWFEVIEGDRTSIRFVGDFSNCDHLGGGLENGTVQVDGDAGDFVADRMTGGKLTVSGSVGRYACSRLRGGIVSVGDCGNYAASANPGAALGMNGGILVVRGNCGPWLATRMRRGTVIVHGDVAAGCASRMIAGTLILCGLVAEPLAANMNRGTILLLGPTADCSAPAGFTDPEHSELSYLQLLMNAAAPFLPSQNLSEGFPRTVWRSMGDRVNGGLGEIIWGTAKQPEI